MKLLLRQLGLHGFVLAPKDMRPDPPSSVGYRAAVAVPYREREHVGPSVSSVLLGMANLWLHGGWVCWIPLSASRFMPAQGVFNVSSIYAQLQIASHMLTKCL